jgi:purine-binding chemotaxis protein CheW
VNLPAEPDHISDTLKARALQLAKPPHDPTLDSRRLTLVEFSLAKERYAIEQAYVREVCRLHQLTALPGVPAFVLGIINVRGQFVCVIDIKAFFDFPPQGITDLHAAIIVRHAGMDLGILADTVVGMKTIAPDTLQPSLPTLTEIRAEYLRGITSDHVVVLDIPRLLTSPRIIVDQNPAS